VRVAEVRTFCPVQESGLPQTGEASDSLVRAAMSQMNLSARAYHRVLKLARTIANLAASEHIQVTQQHVMGSLDFLQIKALAFPI